MPEPAIAATTDNEPIEAWIEVFKTGTHTSMQGNTREYTIEDLDNMVDTYNNQTDEERYIAPVVVGHPVTSSPAWGWVDKLRRVGDVLEAFVTKVDEAFAEAVNAGRYERRSISLFDDGLLEHVGFLGAAPPAVRGLAGVTLYSGAKPLQVHELGNMKAAFALPDASTTPTPAQPTPVQAVQAATEAAVVTPEAAQEARATVYGISIKCITAQETAQLAVKQGNIVKPPVYDALTDDQFGDPVNYRFPLDTQANVIMSIELFRGWDISNQYSLEERQLIGSRIIAAALGFGITPESYHSWHFSNSVTYKGTTHLFSSLFAKGSTMDYAALITWMRTTYGDDTANQTQAQLDQLLAGVDTALMDWITQTFGADVGTAAQAQASAQPATTTASAAEATTTANQTADPATAAATAAATTAAHATAKRLDVLEFNTRKQEFDSFCKGLEDKAILSPAERATHVSLLENAFQSDSKGVTTDALPKLKAHFSGLAPRVDLSSFATQSRAGGGGKKTPEYVPAGVTTDPDSIKLAEEVRAYAKENNCDLGAARVAVVRSKAAA